MKILVTGCLHGEWELLVNTVNQIISEGTKIDLIIVTGDAETMRTEADLDSFAAPLKYRKMGTFHKIYNGEIKVPVLTIVIGGNHESSDFLYLLPFGGWLAENVFYAGRASSLKFGDLSITSISGLYKPEDYFKCVYEKYPIRDSSDIHTVYHLRAFSDFQILGLKSTDIMVSHDWPSTIPMNYGGTYLERRRRDLIKSDKEGTFGLLKGMDIIRKLKPSSWFASHHHITFTADVEGTSFHAIPKTVRPDWFIIADFDGEGNTLKYRGEWISILKATASEMRNPLSLKDINWDQRWLELKDELVPMDDCPIDNFEINPFLYTSKFCAKYGIFCPNEEIRSFSKELNSS